VTGAVQTTRAATPQEMAVGMELLFLQATAYRWMLVATRLHFVPAPQFLIPEPPSNDVLQSRSSGYNLRIDSIPVS
jgi:hypothetical protein